MRNAVKAYCATSEGGRRALPLHSHKKIPFCSKDVDFSSNVYVFDTQPQAQRKRKREGEREMNRKQNLMYQVTLFLRTSNAKNVEHQLHVPVPTGYISSGVV